MLVFTVFFFFAEQQEHYCEKWHQQRSHLCETWLLTFTHYYGWRERGIIYNIIIGLMLKCGLPFESGSLWCFIYHAMNAM
jgi:hypothetical protein